MERPQDTRSAVRRYACKSGMYVDGVGINPRSYSPIGETR